MISYWHLIAAAIYFLIGIALGIFMGVTGDSRLYSVQIHVIGLGWISLSVIALVYEKFPHIKAGWIPKAHLWLHNSGLLLSTFSLSYMQISGYQVSIPMELGGSLLAWGTALWALQLISGLVHKW